MNLFGFTDSLPAHQLEECPQCHSAVHVASGLCLRCLLQAGLAEGKQLRGQNLGVLLSGMSNEVNKRVRKTDVLEQNWVWTHRCARSDHFVVGLRRTKEAQSIKLKYWEIIAENLSKAGWSWGCVSTVDCSGRTIWIADAHRGDNQRFIVSADANCKCR